MGVRLGDLIFQWGLGRGEEMASRPVTSGQEDGKRRPGMKEARAEDVEGATEGAKEQCRGGEGGETFRLLWGD